MEAWREFARCRGMDPEVFHPFPTDDDGQADAKKVCDDCPVRAACLDYALLTGETRGVWGGTTEEERRALRKALVEGEPVGAAAP